MIRPQKVVDVVVEVEVVVAVLKTTMTDHIPSPPTLNRQIKLQHQRSQYQQPVVRIRMQCVSLE